MARLTLVNGDPLLSNAEELAHFHGNTTYTHAWIRVSEPLISACLLMERAREMQSPLGALSRAMLTQLEGYSHGDAMPTVMGWLSQAGAMQELLLATSSGGTSGGSVPRPSNPPAEKPSSWPARQPGRFYLEIETDEDDSPEER